jgi:hypothetical protein
LVQEGGVSVDNRWNYLCLNTQDRWRVKCDAQPIDRVIRIASLMGAESDAGPILAMRVNALGTANVFDHCLPGASFARSFS